MRRRGAHAAPIRLKRPRRERQARQQQQRQKPALELLTDFHKLSREAQERQAAVLRERLRSARS